MTNKPFDIESIRLFTAARDLKRVTEIAGCCFDEPWPAEQFMDYGPSGRQFVYVAEREGIVVGYIAYNEYRALHDILQVAVDPRYRRLGVAMDLIAKVSMGTEGQRVACYVPAKNKPAIHLFRSLGFRAVNSIKLRGKPRMVRYVV